MAVSPQLKYQPRAEEVKSVVYEVGLAEGQASPFFVPEAAVEVDEAVEDDEGEEVVVELEDVEVDNVVGTGTATDELEELTTDAVATLPTLPAAASTRGTADAAAD